MSATLSISSHPWSRRHPNRSTLLSSATAVRFFSNIFDGLTIHMWAWEGQEFNRWSDLAYGNLYLADIGDHRLTFRRNAPKQHIVD